MNSNMVRKQVLVQLDDELLRELDTAADAQGVSRSELLRRGARAVLDALAAVEDDRRLQAAYRRRPERKDSFVEAAARIALRDADEW